MTPDDRQLLAEIDAARATERDLFQRVRAQKAVAARTVADRKRDIARAEADLADAVDLEDASLERLANYDRARREVANR